MIWRKQNGDQFPKKGTYSTLPGWKRDARWRWLTVLGVRVRTSLNPQSCYLASDEIRKRIPKHSYSAQATENPSSPRTAGTPATPPGAFCSSLLLEGHNCPRHSHQESQEWVTEAGSLQAQSEMGENTCCLRTGILPYLYKVSSLFFFLRTKRKWGGQETIGQADITQDHYHTCQEGQQMWMWACLQLYG